MTTRQQLHSHVRKAIEETLSTQFDADEFRDGRLHIEGTQIDLGEMAFAAIEAVYKAIGDHQLAVMIGDTSQAETPRVTRVVVEDSPDDGIEMLQGDESDD